MIITATEFKSNFGRYLEMVEKEDIVITRNGKRIARLTAASRDRSHILQALTGIVPADVSLETEKQERLRKYEDHD